MVTATLQATIDALNTEERISLLEYLERTTDIQEVILTDEQIAILEERALQMDTDPSVKRSKAEFIDWLKATWL